MSRPWTGAVRLLIVAACVGQPGAEGARADGIKSIEAEGLQIAYFDPAENYLVPYATQCFVNSLRAQQQLFGYQPDGGVAILLQDFSDTGNASIVGSPRNRAFIDIAPQNLAFETFSPGERMYTKANHELVHLVTSEMPNAQDRRWRTLLGGKVGPVAEHPESILYQYLTAPRVAAPRWYQEGSAVFMETWMGGGLGRAQGGYDEMVFRAMVRDGATFYDPLGLVSKGTEVDFQTGANAYLYGTRFMSYLALQYSPEQLLAWWRRDDASRRYFADDFARVFGLPLPRAWQDWIEWEHGFQRKNLAAVAAHPITAHRDVARSGLGAISRAYLAPDGETLYAAVRYPGRVPHLVAIGLRNGRVTELAEVRGAQPYRVTSLAFDPESGTLFFTTDHFNYRNLLALDLNTRETRTLIADSRIGDIVFNRADRSLWGLRVNNGFLVVVRLLPPYTDWEAVHVFPYNEVVWDLDLSADGKLAAVSFAGPSPDGSGAQAMQLRVLSTDSLLAGDAKPVTQLELGTAIPEGFIFSPDGRHLYGSSYYTGVSNIFRVEVATGKLEALSNAELGYFRPLPLDAASLLVFRYSAAGFVPATIPIAPTEDLSAITFLGERIAAQRPIVQRWNTPSPASVDFATVASRPADYSPSRELELESLYPVIEGYKDSASVGVHARFSDPVGFDTLLATVGYSPDGGLPEKERLHAAVEYRHSLWTFGGRWNGADFYDLFGPTKRSREGYSAYVGYERPLIYSPPEEMSLQADLAYYGDLDSLPAFQNIASPTDRLLTANLALEYEYPRSSIGYVDDETGHLWALDAHTYVADGEVIPSLFGKFDAGFALPAGHASVWLRSAAGVNWGDRDNPLASAYFGGFGNNYVDNGAAKRYREIFTMPGFEIDALSGKSFVKSMVEWNLPPLRFERWGSPGFYASWARPALFATALVTDLDDGDFREDAYNVGFQVDVQLQVLHRLPMMLSFGYASGFGGGGRGEDEFMLSLKVL
jgi:hypothetical protein